MTLDYFNSKYVYQSDKQKFGFVRSLGYSQTSR